MSQTKELGFKVEVRFAMMSLCTAPVSNALGGSSNLMMRGWPRITCCSSVAASAPSPAVEVSPPLVKRRGRYRKMCPGETKGISEEMRFVAMRLRNAEGRRYTGDGKSSLSDVGGEKTWEPTLEGFLKYLVDSNLVFSTVERIVDESDHVAYACFRKTGLERSPSLMKDLEWFKEQNIAVPQPSNVGITYAKYLEELAENSAPLFLCHFYNIYFSHIAGGQVIAKQVSEKLLEGKELEFYRWEGDTQELLKGVREKLNMLGENWPRIIKTKCLSAASKSFHHLGQIVRLIIL